MSLVEARTAALLNKLSEEDLMEFKVVFLGMPEEIAKHPFFAATNISRWAFAVNRYTDYIRSRIALSGSRNEQSAPPAYSDIDPNGPSSSSSSSKTCAIPPGSEGAVPKDGPSRANKRKIEPDTSTNTKLSKRLRILDAIDLSSDSGDEIDNPANRKLKLKAPVKKKQAVRDERSPLREYVDSKGLRVIDLTSP